MTSGKKIYRNQNSNVNRVIRFDLGFRTPIYRNSSKDVGQLEIGEYDVHRKKQTAVAGNKSPKASFFKLRFVYCLVYINFF